MTNPSRPTPAAGDPSAFLARLSAMEQRIAALETNQPGYGNLSSGSKGARFRVPYYLRDLFDCDLYDIKDGQVPKWTKAAGVGKFRPGNAGGVGFASFFAGAESPEIPSSVDTVVQGWAVNGWNEPGLSIINVSPGTNNAIQFTAGKFMVWAQTKLTVAGVIGGYISPSADYYTGHYFTVATGPGFTHTTPAILNVSAGAYVQLLVSHTNASPQVMISDFHFLRLP